MSPSHHPIHISTLFQEGYELFNLQVTVVHRGMKSPSSNHRKHPNKRGMTMFCCKKMMFLNNYKIFDTKPVITRKIENTIQGLLT